MMTISKPAGGGYESNRNLTHRVIAMLLGFILLAGCATSIVRPGLQSDGSVLLSNRWSLTPAGEQIPVGDLPLAMALTPDDQWLVVANNGYADQYVSIINLADRKEVAQLPMEESWLGLTFDSLGRQLFVSGGGSDRIEVFDFNTGSASQKATLQIKDPTDKKPYFVAGLALSPDDRTLFACALRQNKLAVFDLTNPVAPEYIEVGAYPYAVVVSANGDRAYISNWGGKSISVVDLLARQEVLKIPVGDHPNAMALSSIADRLYVANASSNELSVIDTVNNEVRQVLDLSPYQGAPRGGATPNGINLSADGQTLYLVSADNNSLTVIDVSGDQVQIRGSIPTGWYPTDVKSTRDLQTLIVTNGKGLASAPNPEGPQPTDSTESAQYIGELFPGTVSVIDVPDAQTLSLYAQQVRKNNGFDQLPEDMSPDRAGVPARAIPRRRGEPSLIKHVFYIIKENRTYDQVLGDMPQGEGDPNLTLFGYKVTPNEHALAEEFVLFDNFYVDAEVSMDGHSWTLGAIATDFVEKLWPTNYSGRSFPQPIYFLDIAYPYAGYLWDMASIAGISYRTYGEYVSEGKDGRYVSLEVLKGHFSPDYPGLDLTIRDSVRADVFIAELQDLIAKDRVPQLNILQLPGDHTFGARPGMPTPRSMVADNDLALGRIIEAISKSPIWAESVVFVIQDDSQNGPDHIDAHRTTAFVASPYARRQYVDHSMYDTVSLLKTIELILGLPPMSQYDAAAIPMFTAFQDEANLASFQARPNQWPLDELNPVGGQGADLSMEMNFDELDAAPELLLNEIIWKSVKGSDSVMPRPHTQRNWIDTDDD